MTPEQQNLYIDSCILKALDDNPGLSGDELIRYSNGIALVDCEAVAENEDDQTWFEMLVVRVMSRDNIFRRCDDLLESGDIRFDVEEDAWFSC
tara:strand:- start:2426 stop:2704 length:279 start_codon:yes stop_codon:yes gene_type:complete